MNGTTMPRQGALRMKAGYFRQLADWMTDPCVPDKALKVVMLLKKRGFGEDCFPNHETLAGELGVSVPTVRRILDRMEELRILWARPRWERNDVYFYEPVDGARQTSNEYWLDDADSSPPWLEDNILPPWEAEEAHSTFRPALGWGDALTFGRYKGSMVQEVFDWDSANPTYLRWLVNHAGVALSSDVLAALGGRVDPPIKSDQGPPANPDQGSLITDDPPLNETPLLKKGDIEREGDSAAAVSLPPPAAPDPPSNRLQAIEAFQGLVPGGRGFWPIWKLLNDENLVGAREAFLATVTSGLASIGLVIDQAEAYGGWCEASGRLKDGFCQQAATWLQQEQWRVDWMNKPMPAKKGGKGTSASKQAEEDQAVEEFVKRRQNRAAS